MTVIHDHRLSPLGQLGDVISALNRPPGRSGATLWTLEIRVTSSTPLLLVAVGRCAGGPPAPDGWGVQYEILSAPGVSDTDIPAYLGLFGLRYPSEHEAPEAAPVRAALTETTIHPSVWRWLVLA